MKPHLRETPRPGAVIVPLVLTVLYVSLRLDRLPLVAVPAWSGAYIDEISQVIYGLHVLEGVTPAMLAWPATLYTFVLAALNAGDFALKALLGQFGTIHSVPDFITAATEYFLSFYRDPSGWVIAARIVSLTFGVATLLCIHALTRRHVGATGAWAAAAVYATFPLDRFLAQVGVTETASAFFAVAAMRVTMTILNGAGTGADILLGALIGLGLGTKFLVAVVIVPAALAVLVAGRASPRAAGERRGRLIRMLLSLATFTLLANPYLLTQPAAVLKEIITHPLSAGRDFGSASLAVTVAHLLESFGTPTLVLASIGAASCLWRRRWTLGLAVCLPAALIFLAVYSHSLKYHRYLIIMGPSLAILAGVAVQDLAAQLAARDRDRGGERRAWAPTGAALVIAAAALAFTSQSYGVTVRAFDGTGLSTVGDLEAWIEKTIPPHSSLIFWGITPQVERDLASLGRTISTLDSLRMTREAKWQSAFPGTHLPRAAAFDNLFTIDEQLLLRSLQFTAELRRREGDSGYDMHQVRTRTVSYGMPPETVFTFARAHRPTYVAHRESDRTAAGMLSGLTVCYRAGGVAVRSSSECPVGSADRAASPNRALTRD